MKRIAPRTINIIRELFYVKRNLTSNVVSKIVRSVELSTEDAHQCVKRKCNSHKSLYYTKGRKKIHEGEGIDMREKKDVLFCLFGKHTLAKVDILCQTFLCSYHYTYIYVASYFVKGCVFLK